MRLTILTLVLFTVHTLSAQTQVPLGGIDYSQRNPFNYYNHFSDSNNLNKKWSLNSYGGFSAGFSSFNNGSTMISAPIGLQLNRRLNNNVYAFAGVSAAPAYFNFSRSINHSGSYMNYPGSSRFMTNQFGMYSRVEVGLMYINDAKTFSVSGSFGIDKRTYPGYPGYPANNFTTPKRQPVTGSRQ